LSTPKPVNAYPVKEPYTWVFIRSLNGAALYEVKEPTLSEEERRALENVKKLLINRVGPSMNGEVEKWLEKTFKKLLPKALGRLKKEKREAVKEAEGKLLYYVKRDMLGYGKLDPLIRDPNVEDVSVVGPGRVYVWHRLYGNMPSSVVLDENEVRELAFKLSYKAGGQVSASRPFFDGRLPEGHRVHVVLREVSPRGESIDIRRHVASPYTFIDLINLETLSSELAAYMWLMVEFKRGIIFTGETGAGKTTMLNAVASFIPPEAKVVTVEEAREVNIPHRCWVSLVTREMPVDGWLRVTLFDLVKQALRQRPDYLIVGEVRGEEAYTLFQALSLGHGGLSTLHAESVEAAVKRLTSKPMDIPKHLIGVAGCFVHLAKHQTEAGLARRVVEVVEPVDDRFNAVWRRGMESPAESQALLKAAYLAGKDGEWLKEELEARAKLLSWMSSKASRLSQEEKFKLVADFVRRYTLNPEELKREARLEGVAVA